MKNKKIYCIVLLLASVFHYSYIFTQIPEIEWQKTLGSPYYESSNLAISTYDNCYIVLGNAQLSGGDISSTYGGGDIWLVKLDIDGNILWEKTYGGSNYDVGHCIIETNNGGFIISGESRSEDGDIEEGGMGYSNALLIKLDSLGNIEWQKCYGGVNNEVFGTVYQTADSGYIALGQTNGNDGDVSGTYGYVDLWLVKLDEIGNIEWQTSYGGEHIEHISSFQPDDEGYIIGATFEDIYTLEVDVLIIKVDENGELIWEQRYGGAANDAYPYIIGTDGEGYIFVASTESSDGDVSESLGHGDIWIVKIDEDGNIIWERTYGGSGTDYGSKIISYNQRGFLITAFTASEDGDISDHYGNYDWWVFEIDLFGNLIDQKCFGGSANDVGVSISETKDKGYILSGRTSSNNGDITDFKGIADEWVIKLKSPVPEDTTTTGLDQFDYESNDIKIYPNPAKEKIFIEYTGDQELISEIKVFNILGRLYLHSKIHGTSTVLDIERLSKGSYIIQIQTSKGNTIHLRQEVI